LDGGGGGGDEDEMEIGGGEVRLRWDGKLEMLMVTVRSLGLHVNRVTESSGVYNAEKGSRQVMRLDKVRIGHLGCSYIICCICVK
jgi:hypothetical protein